MGKVKRWILDTKFFFPIELLKWVVVDKFRASRSGVKIFKDHGIYMVCGTTGGGKTTFAVWYILNYIIPKYGRENIYIASNLDLPFQDFKLTHYYDLTLYYNKPLIAIYDEANSDFNAMEYKDIDSTFRHSLAQNRKGYSKCVLAISQDYSMLNNNFRRLCKKVYFCKTLWNRWTRVKRYDRLEYEELISTVEIDKKMKLHPEITYSFIQTDKLRENYDSYQVLESIKKSPKDFVIRKELLGILDYRYIDLNKYQVEK